MLTEINKKYIDTKIDLNPKNKRKVSGHLFRGPTISAFNRKSLSTIPTSNEVVLFKKPSELFKNKLKNNTELTSHGENIKIALNRSEDECSKRYLDSISPNNLSHISSLSKSESRKKNIKKDLPERFYDNYMEKYYPGPGQYKPMNNCISDENVNSMRYKSLFNCGRENFPDIFVDYKNMNNTGPGVYYNDDFAQNLGGFYLSPYRRFIPKKIPEYQKILGPGAYDFPSDFEVNKKTSFFFKRGKHDNEKEKVFIPNEEKIIKNREGKQSKDVGFNFNKKRKKHDKEQSKDFKQIKEDIEKEFAEQFIEPIKIKVKVKPPVEKENKLPSWLTGVSELVEIKDSSFRKDIGVSIPKEKRFKNDLIKHKHVPGPSYYKPSYIPAHKNFNANMDNNWL